MEGNNISGKIAKDRDIWLEQEKHLLKELMKNDENKKVKENREKDDAYKLYKEAIRLIEEIESGKLEDDEIKKKVEEITLLFAAIEDCQKEIPLREKLAAVNPNLFEKLKSNAKNRDDGRDDR